MDYQEDPNMQFTQWNSMSNSVSTSKIRLKKTNKNSLKTISSGRFDYIIFPSILLIFVIGVLIFADLTSQFSLKNYFGLTFFIGIIAFALFYFHKKTFQQSIFDFDKMKFTQGNNQITDLNNIEAIQLLTYHHSSSSNYTIRFEINLVKSSGERFYLFNNASYKQTIKQAELLANKLELPIWDAS